MITRGTGAPPRIIVVEDEHITAMDIKKQLLRLGYEVPATASSGEEAIAEVAEFHPDLVLMDIVLRGTMDGIETAGRIRSLFHTPIIYLTAFSDSTTLRRAKVTEPFGYILKPFDEREIFHTTIEMALYKHKMEKRFRSTVEGAEAGYFRIGEDGRFEDVNEAWLRMHGYSSREEIIGQHYSITQLDPDLEQAQSVVAAVLHGEVIPNGEFSRKCKGGSVGYHSFSIQPVWDHGTIVGLEGFLIDMTERMQAEEALRESNTFNESLLATLPFGIDIVDENGIILYMSKTLCDLVGEDALGQTCWSAYRDDKKQCHDCPLLRKTMIDDPEVIETSNVFGGRAFQISHIGMMYKGRKALLEVFQDLTDQKQLEQQLRQAQKMESMGTMVGGISHDFNNILNNILGFVYQLRKYAHNQEKVAKYTDTIEKSATRGAELANQLLSFVRHKKQDDEPIDVTALVDEVATLFMATIPKDINLVKKLDGRPLFVLGGRGELYQALLNLCLNARDAMMQGGTLTIEAASETIGGETSNAIVAPRFTPGQTCIRIQVSDTGTGIPGNIREKIFDPFFTTKDRGRGTGLGLSIVYNIVKNHKGTITVNSEEGKGSSFAILLPAREEEPIREEPRVEEPDSRVQSKGRILLVDDEVGMLELGKELLENEGYDVLTAADGLQALQIYRERSREITLVVLDLVMPKLDGGQTFLEMKRINPGVKAFFCTGYSSDQVIASLLVEERLRALQKPFRPVEFTKMVREVLSQ